MARKKAEGHHGGAWKVAYADFVTAMMALFMVLWISSQDKEILLATSRYFKQPFNALTDFSVGVLPGKDGGSIGNNKASDQAPVANVSFLNALAGELSKLLDVKDLSDDAPVDFQVSSDALRITVYDRPRKPMFEKGSSKLTKWGEFVLQNLAWTIDRNRLNVYIDGYAASRTDNAGGVADENYGPWEISTDRANMTRRALERFAVESKLIERVTGYGDTRPLPAIAKNANGNDRISISLSTKRQ